MSTYLYDLPTTGAISFNDFCADETNVYVSSISEATQARANMRTALKETKRTDGAKDYLKLVKIIDDYLAQLYGIKACLDAHEIILNSEPVLSWRSTLSSKIFNSSRQTVRSLHADIAFTLLTYGFVLSNLAYATVAALGQYEYERGISETQRQANDSQVNFAVTLLCRASGVFQHISERVLPEWHRASSASSSPSFDSKPLDVNPEITSALSKMALADAQTLAVRKLLSKAAYDSQVTPGPPLPKSHPSPSLIEKLFLECASLYSSARALVKTPGKARDADDVLPSLRHYLADEARYCSAMAHKWAGVDGGEVGGEKAGQAVAFLQWAKEELEELRGDSKGISMNHGKDKKERKGKINDELAAVITFLRSCKKINDSLHFQPVPSTAELQTLIPAGRLAVAVKPFIPPQPAFGPGSVEYLQRQADGLNLEEFRNDTPEKRLDSPNKSYVGAGAYF